MSCEPVPNHLRFSDNQREAVIVAGLDLAQATGKYAIESLRSPGFLAASWKKIVTLVRRQAKHDAWQLG